MKIFVCLPFFVLFSIFMPGNGEAFVPQAPHLLHLVIEKIKQPVGIETFQTKKILNYQDPDKEVIELKERLIYKNPGRVRSEILSDHSISFSVESDLGFVKVVNGVIVTHEKPLADLYTDILFYRDYQSLLNQISLAGVDTGKVTFQRYKDTVCYVIGRSLGKGKPFTSLWIEKDTVFPVKYVVRKNGLLIEFFYHNWKRISRTWYPMQVRIFLDNQLFATVDVQRVDLKSGFPASLFDIEYIQRLYPVNDPDSLDENSKQIDELDKGMENFKKLYE